jgi:hypothetical protein
MEGISKFLPCGPITSPGELNYKRYTLRISPPGNLPHYDSLRSVMNLIEERDGALLEVVIDDRINHTGLSPIGEGGYTVYARFPSTEVARDFPDIIDLHGHIIKIWHRGRLVCDQCNEKGHSTGQHHTHRVMVKNYRRRQRILQEKIKNNPKDLP